MDNSFYVRHIEHSDHEKTKFEEYDQACDFAIDGSIDDNFWGVWNPADDLVAIVYQGQVFGFER